jgi:plasmid stability protein
MSDEDRRNLRYIAARLGPLVAMPLRQMGMRPGRPNALPEGTREMRSAASKIQTLDFPLCTDTVLHNMKNITVRVDDATYQRARVRAAEAGTSVSAMVRDFLNAQESETERLERVRTDALRKLYGNVEERSKQRKRSVKPMTRDEIYRERIR